jgi:hypothetical protein
MTFNVDIRHWPTAAAFAAHLQAHDPCICAWARGLTVHHTAVPGASWAPEVPRRRDREWDRNETGLSRDAVREKRQRQVDGVAAYYRDTLGWSAGPHLFIDDLFIWQMTPLNLPGIHAPHYNATHWGIEVAGDYTRTSWPAPVRVLALGAAAALLRWVSIPVSPLTVNAHRDDNKPSCPGNAVDMGAVRAALAALCDEPCTVVTPDASLFAPPRASIDAVISAILTRPTGAYTAADVRAIIARYWQLCVDVGLDPLIVVAQLIHETGNLTSWWSQRPRRNPAGIGVTGAQGAGLSFATWADDAIPAHVGRLLAYALPVDHASLLQRALITEALALRPLPAVYRGSVQALRDLSGRWAIDATYAEKIARVAARLTGGTT